MTLQKSIVDLITQSFNDKSTELFEAETIENDILFKECYYLLKTNNQFTIQEADPNRKYGKITKEYTPIIYTAFDAKTIPISNLRAEDATINITVLIPDDKTKEDNFTVIEETLFDFRGRFKKIDTFNIGFNASIINPPSEPIMWNGKHRIPVSFSIYYQAGKEVGLGNQVSYTLGGETINRLNNTQTVRNYTPEDSNVLDTSGHKAYFKETSWQHTTSFMIDTSKTFYDDLLDELENTDSNNKTYSYTVTYPVSDTTTYPNGKTYSKTISFQSISLDANIGTFAIFTVIMKESGF